MSSVAVVWWSGSGNTEKMAQAVAEGAKAAGAEVELISVSEFDSDEVENYDALAFGCPAMGAEELEGCEFAPVWSDCIFELEGKPVVLFGSYGWGEGEWLESWKEEAEASGIDVIDILAINDEPDDEGLEACKLLGEKLS